MISASELQQVLDRLPPMQSVAGDYIRIFITPPLQATPNDGQHPRRDSLRHVEFVKGRDGWELNTLGLDWK